MRLMYVLTAFFVIAIGSNRLAVAQCEPRWLVTEGTENLVNEFGHVSDTPPMVMAFVEWDPDGGGPETPMLVIGGSFWGGGRVISPKVIGWRNGEFLRMPPIPWEPFHCTSLAVIDGVLVAGTGWAWSVADTPYSYGEWVTYFALVNGTWVPYSGPLGEARRILKHERAVYAATGTGVWQMEDGAWTRLGAGEPTRDIAVADGQLFRATATEVQRWSGEEWTALAPQLYDTVYLLGVLDGQLHRLRQPWLAPSRIERWDGSAWQLVADYYASTGPIQHFSMVSGLLTICTTQGLLTHSVNSWTQMGSGFMATRLAQFNGEIIAAAGPPHGGIWRQSGHQWSPATETYLKRVDGVTHWRSRRVVVGSFRPWTSGQPEAAMIEHGDHYRPMRARLKGDGRSAAAYGDRIVIAGDNLRSESGELLGPLAIGDDNGWTAMRAPGTPIAALDVGDGDLIAAVGGCSNCPSFLSRWNGASWEQLTPVAPPGHITRFLRADDRLYAAVGNALNRWNVYGLVNGIWVDQSPAGDLGYGPPWVQNGVLNHFVLVGSNSMQVRLVAGAWSPAAHRVYWPPVGPPVRTPSGEVWLVRAGNFVEEFPIGHPSSVLALLKPDGHERLPAPAIIAASSNPILVLSRGELGVTGRLSTADGWLAGAVAILTAAGAPAFAMTPYPTTTCAGRHVELFAAATGGPEHAWRRGGVPITDGPTPWGSIVSGAASTTLVIENAQPQDSGVYECVATNPCGSANLNVPLTVTPVCPCSPADIASGAGLSPDGVLDGADFDAFIGAFFDELRRPDGTLIADLDDGFASGGADGLLTGADFDRFIKLFFAGCP